MSLYFMHATLMAKFVLQKFVANIMTGIAISCHVKISFYKSYHWKEWDCCWPAPSHATPRFHFSLSLSLGAKFVPRFCWTWGHTTFIYTQCIPLSLSILWLVTAFSWRVAGEKQTWWKCFNRKTWCWCSSASSQNLNRFKLIKLFMDANHSSDD